MAANEVTNEQRVEPLSDKQITALERVYSDGSIYLDQQVLTLIATIRSLQARAEKAERERDQEAAREAALTEALRDFHDIAEGDGYNAPMPSDAFMTHAAQLLHDPSPAAADLLARLKRLERAENALEECDRFFTYTLTNHGYPDSDCPVCPVEKAVITALSARTGGDAEAVS
jgi:hypothetical protein